jgi:hypothetical protein
MNTKPVNIDISPASVDVILYSVLGTPSEENKFTHFRSAFRFCSHVEKHPHGGCNVAVALITATSLSLAACSIEGVNSRHC